MKKLLSAAFVLSTVASSAFAGAIWHLDPGAVTMKFLSMHASPRSAAMSGAGVADPGRASEVLRNPLAMSVVDNAEFGVNEVIFGDGSSNNLVTAYFGLPVFDQFTLSMGMDFLGYGDIEGRDENGLETADYSAYAWALQAGFGSRSKVFNWAISMRFASQTIDDATGFLFGVDAGVSYRVNEYFAFGATVTNFGYASAYESASEDAPLAVQAGISGMIPILEHWDLHLSTDLYRRADTETQVLFGGELAYRETLMLRVGYAVRPDTDDSFSCGLGFTFGMVVFDYGYSPRPALDGGNHYLTVGIKF